MKINTEKTIDAPRNSSDLPKIKIDGQNSEQTKSTKLIGSSYSKRIKIDNKH